MLDWQIHIHNDDNSLMSAPGSRWKPTDRLCSVLVFFSFHAFDYEAVLSCVILPPGGRSQQLQLSQHATIDLTVIYL